MASLLFSVCRKTSFSTDCQRLRKARRRENAARRCILIQQSGVFEVSIKRSISTALAVTFLFIKAVWIIKISLYLTPYLALLFTVRDFFDSLKNRSEAVWLRFCSCFRLPIGSFSQRKSTSHLLMHSMQFVAFWLGGSFGRRFERRAGGWLYILSFDNF